MKIWTALIAACWSMCAYVGVAWACPSCPVGQAARAQVCEDDFVVRMLAVILPFVVMGAVSVWAERAIDRRRIGENV